MPAPTLGATYAVIHDREAGEVGVFDGARMTTSGSPPSVLVEGDGVTARLTGRSRLHSGPSLNV